LPTAHRLCYCARARRRAPLLNENTSQSARYWSGTSRTSGESASVTSTLHHDGVLCERLTTNGGNGNEYSYLYKTIASSSEISARGYFYVSRSGIVENSDRFSFIGLRSGGTVVASAGWRRTGGSTIWCLIIRSGTSSVVAYSQAVPSLNTWYCVELRWRKGSSTGMGELWVDGVRVCSILNKNTSAYGSVNRVQCGIVDMYHCRSTTVNCDCVVVANTYVGPE
jgi:hypothetical protein